MSLGLSVYWLDWLMAGCSLASQGLERLDLKFLALALCLLQLGVSSQSDGQIDLLIPKVLLLTRQRIRHSLEYNGNGLHGAQ